jgi:hypothetical protein
MKISDLYSGDDKEVQKSIARRTTPEKQLFSVWRRGFRNGVAGGGYYYTPDKGKAQILRDDQKNAAEAASGYTPGADSTGVHDFLFELLLLGVRQGRELRKKLGRDNIPPMKSKRNTYGERKNVSAFDRLIDQHSDEYWNSAETMSWRPTARLSK